MKTELEKIADEIEAIGDEIANPERTVAPVTMESLGHLLCRAATLGAFDPVLTNKLNDRTVDRDGWSRAWATAWNHLAKKGVIKSPPRDDEVGWWASCRAIARYIREAVSPGAAASVDDEAHLPPKKLAELFSVEQGPLDSRLRRWRKTAGSGWMDNPDRTSRAAQYLYRVGSIRPILDALKTTGERRAKKK